MTERAEPCGKVRYDTRNAALLALARIKVLNRPHRKERAAHPCDACSAWHLTTKRPDKNGVRGGHGALIWDWR